MDSTFLQLISLVVSLSNQVAQLQTELAQRAPKVSEPLAPADAS